MIPVGESYRAPWGFSPAQALAALVLGSLAAAGAAGLIWVWEWSGIPTLVVITSLIQGGILGGVLAYLAYRLKLRSPLLAVILGLFCGLTSVALVHIGHYLYFVNVEMRQVIQADQTLPKAQKEMMVQLYKRNPTQFTDAILDDQTGHKGLLGFMIARSEQGFQIRNAQLTGWAVFGLWVFEALLVVFPAVTLPLSTSSTPFCDDCDAWCDKRTGLPQYPPEMAEPLADSIRLDDRSGLEKIAPSRLLVVQGPSASTTLHVCPNCEQTFADVGVEAVEKNKVKAKSLVRLQRISPEMVAALGTFRPETQDETVEPETEDQSGEQPADLV